MTHLWGQVPTQPQRPPPRRLNTATTVAILLASIVGLSLLAAPLRMLRDLDDNRGPGLEATLSYPEPKLSDFTLKVKERQRQKFGPAGANITYHIVAGWGPTYDPAKTYALVYEVRGGEYGPVRNYIEVRGDHHKVENDQFISTSHVDQRLVVKAVAVEEMAGAMFTPRSCQPH